MTLTANITTGLYSGNVHPPATPGAGTEFVLDVGYTPGRCESGFQVYDFVGDTWIDNAARLGEYKTEQMQGINRECSRQIIEVAGWPLEKQVSFSNGIYTDSLQKLQYQEDTMATLESSNAVQDAIEVATSYSAVDAAVGAVSWPTFPVPV